MRYILKADAERQADAAIPVSAVSVKVTTAELAALERAGELSAPFGTDADRLAFRA